MNILQNIDVNLKELVDDIEKGNFLIPKFQRDFVWKNPDVESLGDSIIRGYPISSMLMMPVNGTLKVSYTPLKTSGTKSTGSSPLYVLDGQQRLTSIAKIFLGLDETKEYYFDMLSILCDAFPEDEIQSMDGIKERLISKHDRYNGFSEITPELCRSFTRKSGDTSDTRQLYRFIRGKEIIQNKYAVNVNKFLRIFNGISDEFIDKYTNYLTGVFGNISGYGVPVTKINADADLGVVVRVFEKVNTSGKKLTLFDLINAKSFETNIPAYQVGLADYITVNINNLSQQKFSKTAIDNFFDGKGNGEEKTYANLSRFIRAYSASSFLEKDTLPNISNADMLSKDANFWFEGWNKSNDPMFNFIEWLESEKLLSIANLTFVEYIAGLLMIKPKLRQEAVFMKEVKRYILYINIAGISFSKTNLDVIKSFMDFGTYLLNAHEFKKHQHNITDSLYRISSVTPEQLLGWSQGKQQFKAMMYILYFEKTGGKFNVDLLNNPIKFTDNSDEHHIFPKSQTKGNQDKIYSSIGNFTLLNPSGNRTIIKDKSPIDYLKEIKNIYPKDYGYIIDQNILHGFDSAQSPEDAVKVINERLLSIAKLIESYFK